MQKCYHSQYAKQKKPITNDQHAVHRVNGTIRSICRISAGHPGMLSIVNRLIKIKFTPEYD